MSNLADLAAAVANRTIRNTQWTALISEYVVAAPRIAAALVSAESERNTIREYNARQAALIREIATERESAECERDDLRRMRDALREDNARQAKLLREVLGERDEARKRIAELEGDRCTVCDDDGLIWLDGDADGMSSPVEHPEACPACGGTRSGFASRMQAERDAAIARAEAGQSELDDMRAKLDEAARKVAFVSVRLEHTQATGYHGRLKTTERERDTAIRERDEARAKTIEWQGLCDRCGVAVLGPLEPQLAAARAEVASLRSRVASLQSEVGGIVMRIADIADEAFGPFPVQTVDESLSAIERGIFEQRQSLSLSRAEVTDGCAEMDGLRAEAERLRPVVDAACAWAAVGFKGTPHLPTEQWPRVILHRAIGEYKRALASEPAAPSEPVDLRRGANWSDTGFQSFVTRGESEMCLRCDQHIRDHYGGTEYRCHPLPVEPAPPAPRPVTVECACFMGETDPPVFKSCGRPGHDLARFTLATEARPVPLPDLGPRRPHISPALLDLTSEEQRPVTVPAGFREALAELRAAVVDMLDRAAHNGNRSSMAYDGCPRWIAALDHALADLGAERPEPSEAEQIAAWVLDQTSSLSSRYYLTETARADLVAAIRSGAWRSTRPSEPTTDDLERAQARLSAHLSDGWDSLIRAAIAAGMDPRRLA